MKYIKDWGLLVTVILAIIAGAIKYGELNQKTSTDAFEKKKTELNELVEKIKGPAILKSLKILPVGTIVASALKPSEFIKPEMKDVWLPADGRDVPKGSSYPASQLPDLRGMFVRGYNIFDNFKGARDGYFADLGSRDRSGYQKDATKLPNNNFKTSFHSSVNLSHSIAVQHPQGGTFARGGAPPYRTLQITVPGHDHVISSGGDKETRPKNLALYFYVKVK